MVCLIELCMKVRRPPPVLVPLSCLSVVYDGILGVLALLESLDSWMHAM